MSPRRSRLASDGYRGYETRVALVRVRRSYRRVKIECPDDVYALFEEARTADRESLYSLLMDTQNSLVGCEEVARGSLNTVRVKPADIYKGAFLANAAGVILAHNHPSGSCEPSDEDIRFTEAIGRAGEMLGIPLHDHLVIGESSYTSLRARGLFEPTIYDSVVTKGRKSLYASSSYRVPRGDAV